MNRFLQWCNQRNFISVRALMLYVTTWMTWRITAAAWLYAEASKLPGYEVAAVIAAITVPFGALQGFVFKFYSESRSEK